ncbi:MAG: hypothetical protein NC406_01515 [Bacteroides sp.]|nr:hypothetical protein [Bacteroides sp.]MCM1095282.1 hypothetical protein [Terasakiella sp.]
MTRLSFFSAFIGCAMTVCAQQTVFIGEQGYDGLAAAVAAAADGDVITVKADQTLSGNRITVTAGDTRAITIKGEGDSKVKLTRDSKNNNLLFLLNGGNITFENLVFDNNHVDKAMIEANKGTTLHMTDCDIHNAVNKAVQMKTESFITNVTATGCTSIENQGTLLVGENNKVTIDGTADYELYVERGYGFMQGDALTGSVRIKLESGMYTDGRALISGITDITPYTLIGAPSGNYALELIDSQLTMVKYVMRNESTGISYRSVINALKASVANEDGSPVEFAVLESADVTDRLGEQKFPLVIKAAAEGIVLTKTFRNKLFVSNNASFTFDGLTLDCANNNEGFANEFEANQNSATLAFVDCKIINCNASTNVFNVKVENRTLLLDNTTGEAITTPNGINLNGKLNLSGNTNFGINVANAGASITATGALTNAEPVAIIPTALTLATGTVLVKGCDDAARFTLVDTEDWTLAAEGGNLVAAPAPLTLDDPAVEGEGCYLHQPGSDIIIVPAGKVGIIRFDLAEGTSLRYRFTPYVAAVAEGDAPEWSDYDHAAGITLPAAGTLELALTKGERTGARTMYVYDNPELTGITDAALDAAAPARYYDLRGIEVTGADMHPGIYIERRGSSARRIVVR